MFGLLSGLIEDNMDHILGRKNTWESYESMWDPCLRLDVPSLAFICGKYFDKIQDIKEIGMKEYSTTFFLVSKPKMSLGQDRHIYTCTHPGTRTFVRKVC